MQITAKQLRELVNSFPWEDWNTALAEDMQKIYSQLLETSGSAIAADHDVSFDIDDPFLQEHMTTYIGERVTQLSRTSKKDVIRTLRSALAGSDDLSAGELQDRVLGAVREKYDGYETWRALRIARTESAIGYNHGNVLGSAQAGFEQVDVFDGTDDEECAAANGSTWEIDYALENPIAHPNCVRTMTPHAGSDDGES